MSSPDALRALVRGVNDVGSAVAHRLFEAGCAVAIHDGPWPTATRRGMAFADAVFDGRAELAGVAAVRVDDLGALNDLLARRDAIAVVVAEFTAVIERVRPDVLVDARMRKRAPTKAEGARAVDPPRLPSCGRTARPSARLDARWILNGCLRT